MKYSDQGNHDGLKLIDQIVKVIEQPIEKYIIYFQGNAIWINVWCWSI